LIDLVVPNAVPAVEDTEKTKKFIEMVYFECLLSYPKYSKENIDMNTKISIGSPVMVKV
jgi:hypothetical protein